MDEDEDIGALPTGESIAALLTPGLSSADARSMYSKAQSAVEKQIGANLGLLNAAKDRLRTQRVGPSDAEKYFAIAAALGQPTRTGSFGETIGNLGTLLSKYSGAKREAESERESLLEKLGMQTGTEQLGLLMQGQTGAREALRAATATEAAAARAAAAAAGKTAPTFAYDQFGKLREIPAKGTVLYPRTKEEYDAVPIGAFYEVPSGPAQGTIVKKRG